MNFKSTTFRVGFLCVLVALIACFHLSDSPIVDYNPVSRKTVLTLRLGENRWKHEKSSFSSFLFLSKCKWTTFSSFFPFVLEIFECMYMQSVRFYLGSFLWIDTTSFRWKNMRFLRTMNKSYIFPWVLCHIEFSYPLF